MCVRSSTSRPTAAAHMVGQANLRAIVQHWRHIPPNKVMQFDRRVYDALEVRVLIKIGNPGAFSPCELASSSGDKGSRSR
jgi:hypothetical protein